MTHEELLAKITNRLNECTTHDYAPANLAIALRAVVELHKPYGSADKGFICEFCMDRALPAWIYPCPTIQAIEKELK